MASIPAASGEGTPPEKKQRTAASDNRYIPEELRDEILLRLPAKSVVRFKSVSKKWQSRLESNSFIDLYNLRSSSSNYPQQIVYSPDSTYSADRLPPTDVVKFVAGSQDLILPPRLKLSRPFVEGHRLSSYWVVYYYLFGPLSNGIYCVVACGCDKDDVYNVKLTIEIALCNPAIHEYRGVDFSSFTSFVYSLRARKWKMIADYEQGKRHLRTRNIEGLGIHGDDDINYPEITPDLELCPQRFFKGRWHWMAKGSDNEFCVVSFSFDDETFGLIDVPAGYVVRDADEEVYVKAGVFVLNDHLAAIYSSHHEVPREIKFVGITTRSDEKERGGNRIDSIFFEDDDTHIVRADKLGFKEFDNLVSACHFEIEVMAAQVELKFLLFSSFFLCFFLRLDSSSWRKKIKILGVLSWSCIHTSSIESRNKLAKELRRADVVVLTQARVPVIVVGCKLDLRDDL
ncbi:hypothetical protein V2J09_007821 [Rumex salicifolius]